MADRAQTNTHLNVQAQPYFVWPPSFALARACVDQIERAGGLVEYQKHVRDLEQARERLAHLQQQLMRVKGPKRQQRIRDQIERVERKIKGHEKEIRQKWPDGAPEK